MFRLSSESFGVSPLLLMFRRGEDLHVVDSEGRVVLSRITLKDDSQRIELNNGLTKAIQEFANNSFNQAAVPTSSRGNHGALDFGYTNHRCKVS